jgi:hypothetical protein
VHRAAYFLRVNGASLLDRARPQLPGRLPDAGRAVGDDQRRRAHRALLEVAAEVQPRLVALARPELQPEQHLLAFQREAPGDQHALGGLVVGAQLQVDRVQVAVDEIVGREVSLAPRRVALARVLADPRDGRLADDLLAERLRQEILDVSDRVLSASRG